MEVGCLRHPGASTIDSQLLDGGRSHAWQTLETRSPHTEGEADPHHTKLTMQRGKVRKGNV